MPSLCLLVAKGAVGDEINTELSWAVDKLKLDVVTCNSSRGRQGDPGFKVILSYTVGLRPAWATWDIVSKIHKWMNKCKDRSTEELFQNTWQDRNNRFQGFGSSWQAGQERRAKFTSPPVRKQRPGMMVLHQLPSPRPVGWRHPHSGWLSPSDVPLKNTLETHS